MEIDIAHHLGVSREACANETTLRRYAARHNKTLPDAIKVVVGAHPKPEFQWLIEIWENPNNG
jgi:hypothetical protein